jgi:S1-C subfamily serine protease
MNIQFRSVLILTAFILPSSSIYALTPPAPVKQLPEQLALVQGVTAAPDLTPSGAGELANSRSIAQKITVRVKSANNGGSGVLVARKGNTYLVLTNQHVTRGANQFQIKTADGIQHPAKFVPKFKSSYDLALLQFNSDRSYQIAALSDPSPLKVQDRRQIYSAGFPFDSAQIRTSPGILSQLSDVPMQDGTQIGYVINENEKGVRQGMSGGPILDSRGLVVGINTISIAPLAPSYTYFDGMKPTAKLATRYREANWGIPIYNFLTQLDANILYGYDNFPKVQRQVTPTGYMAKLNRETRQQTVRIEDSVGTNGSGVIVAQQGNTYYVLTAKHVVFDVDGTKKLYPNIKTITHDQESYQIQPSDITLAEGVDLAIVKFTSTTKYPVARIGNYIPRGKSTFVFVAGYPGRDKIDSPVWQWQLNPGLIMDKEQGKFQTQDKRSFSEGYDLIYSSISYSGMSGGPLFDSDGRSNSGKQSRYLNPNFSRFDQSVTSA